MSGSIDSEKTAQLLRLVEFADQNPNLFAGRLSLNQELESFEKILEELNAMGPDRRDGAGWKKYFYGLRKHIGQKGPDQLMEWEKKVLKILSDHVEDDEQERKDDTLDPTSFGDEKPLMDYAPIHADEENPTVKIEPCLSPRNEDNSKKNETFFTTDIKMETIDSTEDKTESANLRDHEEERPLEMCGYMEILEKQAIIQKQYYEKMSDDMECIQRSLKSIEESIKSSIQHKDELLQLKKAKLKIKRESKIEKGKNAKAKLQIQTELVEIHRRKNNSIGLSE